MKNYSAHVKSDNKKWIIVLIAGILIAAVLCGIMTDWYRDWNPFCWFGHKYGEDHACTRCGKVEQTQDKGDSNVAFLQKGRGIRYANEGIEMYSNGTIGSVSYSGGGKEYSSWKNGAVHGRNSGVFAGLLVNGVQNMSSDITVGGTCTVMGYFRTGGAVSLTNPTYQLYVASSVPSGPYTGDGQGAIFYKIDCDDVASPTYTFEAGKYLLVSLVTGSNGYYTISDPIYLNVLDADPLPAAPTKTGYTFTGWYTDEDCTVLYTENYVTEDVTLYAGFEPITYTIMFDANNGIGSMASVTMTYDVSYELPTATFTRDSYSFVGWCVDDPNSSEIKLVGDSVSNLTSEQGETVTLYAVWEPLTYTIKFNANGGTGSLSDMTCQLGSTYSLTSNSTAAITREGYTFVGWSRTSSGAVELVDSASVTDLVSEGEITLYAVWEKIKCTVFFIVDGEVYSVYQCDYGTALADLLDQHVNPMFLKLKKDTPSDTVIRSDVEIELAKTELGKQMPTEHYNIATIVVIGLCGLFIIGVIITGAVLAKKKR